jgi:glycosyltransferase involved in cell wall biosynthesis
MCREKGLGTLVDAYIQLRQRGRVPGLRLRVGGSCGPTDERFVNELSQKLEAASVLAEVEFHRNLDRSQKLALLQSMTVFSVPALYGEAFGLYLLEALAAGVPVVQPQTAAFPELVEATGGGVLCQNGDVSSLAEAIESLLLNPEQARKLGETGRRAVFERFSAESMAKGMLEVWRSDQENPKSETRNPKQTQNSN